MAIYLSYLSLEVVKLIRITNLNYEIEIFNHLRDSKIVLQRKTGKLDPDRPLERWERWGGVQVHVLVQQRDLEQREDDQDEDEVNLLIRISN